MLHAVCEAVEKLAKMFWNINHVRNSEQEQFPPFSCLFRLLLTILSLLNILLAQV